MCNLYAKEGTVKVQKLLSFRLFSEILNFNIGEGDSRIMSRNNYINVDVYLRLYV